MSQEQPRRPREGHGDPVESVSGDLAKDPIAPEDAVVMQTAEATVIRQVQPGGSEVVVGGVAVVSERTGLDDRGDATDYPGERIVTESVKGQVVGQYYQIPQAQHGTGGATTVQSKITIGEALDAAARVVGDKPVDRSDAAAIQEAEAIATGGTVITPGGVADTAISAVAFNAGVDNDKDRIKLSYVLTGATAKLPAGKAVTREDADRVAIAEQRSSPNLTTNQDGVAVSMAMAARLNEGGA